MIHEIPTKTELMNTSRTIDEVKERAKNFELEAIETIVNRCLGRQWKVKDLKRFSKVYDDVLPFNYYLEFDGRLVAIVKRQRIGEKYMVSVTPSV